MGVASSIAAEGGPLLKYLRTAVRMIFESPRLAYLRTWLFQIEVARERKRLYLSSHQNGLKTLSGSVVRKIKSRKPEAHTAYILGTGASGAKLSPHQLAQISSQFSIGVNQWMLHTMIPDVYAYEVDHDTRLLQSLDREDVRLNPPLILFLRPKDRHQQDNVAYIPEFLRPSTFLYGRANLWTRRTKNISSDASAIRNWLNGTQRFDVLLDNGASIVRMIVLSALMGFRRIVLVGVDLNNVRYFWHEDASHLRRLGIRNFETGQRGKVHETLSATNRPFPIDVFVSELAVSLGEDGLSLEVESPDSLLAARIPVTVW